ncbi:hypothetical protein N473_01525 [Pseudoalteromonas luteoviolacea CPMOR-1]|uniref:Uncharacterized protein n=1 Tax=Pseudoalteromonas luteoviolacea CPMOR-1 TaxID=1365248 RepID=A0A162BPS7_9GAMM|nr:hypothetical protein [Pseudoalteromonas luteoviolacea]KZN65277.1 hypothetical protein N473_01525 [Pseudoalteromonas luteoviolacea CPMOR-1]
MDKPNLTNDQIIEKAHKFMPGLKLMFSILDAYVDTAVHHPDFDAAKVEKAVLETKQMLLNIANMLNEDSVNFNLVVNRFVDLIGEIGEQGKSIISIAHKQPLADTFIYQQAKKDSGFYELYQGICDQAGWPHPEPCKYPNELKS